MASQNILNKSKEKNSGSKNLQNSFDNVEYVKAKAKLFKLLDDGMKSEKFVLADKKFWTKLKNS